MGQSEFTSLRSLIENTLMRASSFGLWFDFSVLLIATTLVVMIAADIRMPEMDGYTLARQLRNAPRTSLIPIIFLTAKDGLADCIQGFRAGIDPSLTIEPHQRFLLTR